MPPESQQKSLKLSSSAAVEQMFPPSAIIFIHEGLQFTVHQVYGDKTDSPVDRHVSGQQLSIGLRDLALARWGRLAMTVLARWNIHCTYDFGRVVYQLIDGGQLSKMPEDSIEDFNNVFDFQAAFETDYCLPSLS